VFRTGSFPAAYKAVTAATGIGGPGFAPPRQPLDEEQTAGLIKRLTALDVLSGSCREASMNRAVPARANQPHRG
jgi:hypothetical protein